MKLKILFVVPLMSQLGISQTLIEHAINDPVEFERLQAVDLQPKFAENLPKPTALSVENVAQARTLEQQINQYIVQQNWKVLPELLKQYQQQAHYDQALVHYAWGGLFYAQQDYKKAIVHYQQFLTLKPELAYPRFDYGVMLFENRQYRQAKAELQQSYPQLEPAMQSLAQKYLVAMAEQQGWQPYLNLQYVQTDNVNNASSSKVVRINGREFVKDAESLPQKAKGFRYGVGVDRDLNITGNHFVRSELGYNGVYYWNNKQYNEQSVRLGLGYTYRTAKQTFSVTPFVEQNWLGSARYNRQFGADLSHSTTLNSHWELNNHLVHTQKRYRDTLTASRYNGFQNRFINGLRWQAIRNWQFFANMELMQDKVKEKASSSQKWLGTIGVVYRDKNWGSQLSASYGKRYFKDIHYLYRYKRQDKETQLNWTLWHNQLAWKGFVPKLNFRYQKINSNMPDFYSRSSAEWFVTVDKFF